MVAACLPFALTIAIVGQASGDAPAGNAIRKEQLEYFKGTAAELTLKRGHDSNVTLALTAEPVLRYSNEERYEAGSSDGATFLWLDGALPVAVVSLSIRRPDNNVHRECTSLIGEPLECSAAGSVFWRPKSGGLLVQKLDDAPEPVGTKVRRLAQMRTLAEQFSVACYHPRTNEPTQLRLLTTPLYRYADEQNGILDGALFAFVVSNDPEIFLLLEAARRPDDKAAWQFSLARMSSLRQVVQLNGREVWSVTNFHQDRSEDKKTGPYTTALIGKFTTSAAPPQTKQAGDRK